MSRDRVLLALLLFAALAALTRAQFVAGAARNLGSPINSGALDFCPIVSPDGKYFFFTSERSFTATPLTARLNYERLMKQLRGARNGLGDIYQVDIGALNLGRNAR